MPRALSQRGADGIAIGGEPLSSVGDFPATVVTSLLSFMNYTRFFTRHETLLFAHFMYVFSLCAGLRLDLWRGWRPLGAVVPAAKITITNSATGAVRDTSTDAAGRYEAPGLPAGVYEIRVAKQGFTDELRTGVHLAVGQMATVDLALRLGQSAQAVTVDADAPIVNSAPADMSGLVSEPLIKDLPLNGRSYDELLTLNPGVVNFTWEKTGGIGVSNSTNGNNFAVSGNRPQQNLFLLNGVEFTGAAENNMQPGGASQQLLGVDAVREFNALRDSYGAEYGKRPGAQVAIVTQSGTNALHGSLYEFMRNNAFDARNFFDGASAPGFPAQSVRRRHRRPGAARTRLSSSATTKASASTCTRPASIWFPTTTRATASCPAQLVTPAPSPCPRLVSRSSASRR